MLRTLGVVLGGVFVGAVAMEIVHKKYPRALETFYGKVGELGAGIKEGFKEGYQNTTKSAAART